MDKVIILGSAGAGKSTFARALSKKTGLPLHYLDMLWHKPDKTTITTEEFDAALDKLLQTDKWIIDGNYSRTLERRLIACDTAFLLDYPTEVCLEGAQSRIGKQREDLPWLETEFDPNFKQWIIDFQRNKMPTIYKFLNTYSKNRNIIIFKSRAEADEYLQG